MFFLVSVFFCFLKWWIITHFIPQWHKFSHVAETIYSEQTRLGFKGVKTVSKPSLRQGKSESRSGPDRVPRCMTRDKICNMQTIGLAQGDLNGSSNNNRHKRFLFIHISVGADGSRAYRDDFHEKEFSLAFYEQTVRSWNQLSHLYSGSLFHVLPST